MKRDTHAILSPPSDSANASQVLNGDLQEKLLRKAVGALDFKTCAASRKIADDAIDRGQPTAKDGFPESLRTNPLVVPTIAHLQTPTIEQRLDATADGLHKLESNPS